MTEIHSFSDATDPAQTLSAQLPSGDLTVLDPRFPIRLAEPPRLFWQLIAGWENRETVVSETIRATQQHTNGEERFIQPLPGPALPPVPYPPLAPAALDDDWDTATRAAVVPAGDGWPQRPATSRPRGPDGRFLPAVGDD